MSMHWQDRDTVSSGGRGTGLKFHGERAGEMAQWFRAFVALIQDLGLTPSTHMVARKMHDELDCGNSSTWEAKAGQSAALQKQTS